MMRVRDIGEGDIYIPTTVDEALKPHSVGMVHGHMATYDCGGGDSHDSVVASMLC